MAKKRAWPSTLKPLSMMEQIWLEAARLDPDEEAGWWSTLAPEVLGKEIKERVALLSQHFGMQYPDNEDAWLALLFELAKRAGVPGFRFATRGPGASQKWTEQLNRELLAEVEKLTKKGMTDHAACVHIARNAAKYQNKYTQKSKTLHRQFLRAKRAFEIERFAKLYGSKSLGDWYSVRAKRGHRKHATRQSKQEKMRRKVR